MRRVDFFDITKWNPCGNKTNDYCKEKDGGKGAEIKLEWKMAGIIYVW
jgi:hypothetical protein